MFNDSTTADIVDGDMKYVLVNSYKDENGEMVNEFDVYQYVEENAPPRLSGIGGFFKKVGRVIVNTVSGAAAGFVTGGPVGAVVGAGAGATVGSIQEIRGKNSLKGKTLLFSAGAGALTTAGTVGTSGGVFGSLLSAAPSSVPSGASSVASSGEFLPELLGGGIAVAGSLFNKKDKGPQIFGQQGGSENVASAGLSGNVPLLLLGGGVIILIMSLK